MNEKLLAECRTLAYAVAPELSRQPLYIVPIEFAEGLAVNRCDVYGWAYRSRNRILALEARLRDRDDYRGPGNVVAIDFENINEKFGQHARQMTLQVAVHEAAHLLPCGNCEVVTRPVSAVCVAVQEDNIRRIVDSKNPLTVDHDEHGKSYVRRCCHLLGRARFAGYTFPSWQMFGPQCPTFLQPSHWLDCLLPEVFAMRNESFETIESSPPLVEFTEMWDRDRSWNNDATNE